MVIFFIATVLRIRYVGMLKTNKIIKGAAIFVSKIFEKDQMFWIFYLRKLIILEFLIYLCNMNLRSGPIFLISVRYTGCSLDLAN